MILTMLMSFVLSCVIDLIWPPFPEPTLWEAVGINAFAAVLSVIVVYGLLSL